jgi:parvulin-like peptidyl-prolyl isomerase
VEPIFVSDALRKALLLLVALTLALAASACGGSGSDDDSASNDGGQGETTAAQTVPADAVALVAGQPVPKTAFDQLVSQAQATYKAEEREFPKPGTADYEAIKNQAVQFLVQRAQFEQEAKALGITITDADVDKRLDELKEQFFGGDDKQYQDALKEQGLTEEQVKADVRAQVVSEKLFETVTKDVNVTDADIQKYYDENKAQYEVQETRDVRHILVKTKKQADDLYAQLQDGADFGKLAKQFSDDPGSKDNGGKYEAVQKGQFVPEFDKYLFSAETNALSKPVKTSFGWHLIEPLSEITPPTTTPLAEVKTTIRQQLEEQRKNEAMTKWIDGLPAKYEGKIAYQVGFAPPATPAADTTAGAGSMQGDTSP